MPRTYQSTERHTHAFSSDVLQDMSRMDNQIEAGPKGAPGEPDVTSARLQQISAFLPLSRWIARVQVNGSRKRDA
jgi:hypothetical protein